MREERVCKVSFFYVPEWSLKLLTRIYVRFSFSFSSLRLIVDPKIFVVRGGKELFQTTRPLPIFFQMNFFFYEISHVNIAGIIIFLF